MALLFSLSTNKAYSSYDTSSLLECSYWLALNSWDYKLDILECDSILIISIYLYSLLFYISNYSLLILLFFTASYNLVFRVLFYSLVSDRVYSFYLSLSLISLYLLLYCPKILSKSLAWFIYFLVSSLVSSSSALSFVFSSISCCSECLKSTILSYSSVISKCFSSSFLRISYFSFKILLLNTLSYFILFSSSLKSLSYLSLAYLIAANWISSSVYFY